MDTHNIFILTTALATATESLPYVDEMVARYCGRSLYAVQSFSRLSASSLLCALFVIAARMSWHRWILLFCGTNNNGHLTIVNINLDQ